MKVLVVIVLVVLISSADSDSEYYYDEGDYEYRIEVGGHITGGDEAVPKQFPYMVGFLIILKNGDTSWCGGTLISNTWILTAAHCTYKAKSLIAFLGTTKIMDGTEANQDSISLTRDDVIDHEKYYARRDENDIALVKLPKPVQFSDYIKTANLPKIGETATFAGKKAIASGWGRDSDAAISVSKILRWVEVPIMESKECDKWWTGLDGKKQVCIDTKGGKSACDGDSGGPLTLSDGSNIVVGVTSFGHVTGCETGHPLVFTRVTYYLDWIKNHTGISNE